MLLVGTSRRIHRPSWRPKRAVLPKVNPLLQLPIHQVPIDMREFQTCWPVILRALTRPVKIPFYGSANDASSTWPRDQYGSYTQ